MIEFELDGQTLEVEPGTTIIQAADQAGVYIPRFCYHEKLSAPANCRMCLVDVEKAPKTLPACATPVAPGMKVSTRSPAALKSQKQVMEFLLVNHPLDCPICDQGGECELQDLSMGYGAGVSNLTLDKRCVPSFDLGPLISTFMTRCIHCTRCIRFGEEVAGISELGAVGRSNEMEVTTYVPHLLESELSGNIIDICPVGALTSKPYQYKARSWEMRAHPSIGVHNGLGVSTEIHTRGCDNHDARRIMRVVPRQNDAINQCWLSDRDRFSYEGFQCKDRIQAPMMKLNGEWNIVSWTTVLNELVDRMRTWSAPQTGHSIQAWLSPSTSIESGFLLQQLVRSFGSDRIDYRLRQTENARVPASLMSDCVDLDDLALSDACFLLGANVSQHYALLASRIRDAVSSRRMKVYAMASQQFPYHFDCDDDYLVESAAFDQALGQLLHAYLNTCEQPDQKLLDVVSSFNAPDQKDWSAWVEALQSANQATLIVGEELLHHPQWPQLHRLIEQLRHHSAVRVVHLTDGANSRGLHAMGCFSKNQDPVKESSPLVFLLNVEPEYDCAESSAIKQAITQASCVVSMSAFDSPALRESADFILPITPSVEDSGSLVSIFGQYQSYTPASAAMGHSKSSWKILCVLGNMLDLPGFDWPEFEALRSHCEEKLQESYEGKQADNDSVSVSLPLPLPFESVEATLTRVAPCHAYRVDSVVRRAPALQSRYRESWAKCLRIHSETAQSLGLKEGLETQVIQASDRIELALHFDDSLAKNVVHLPVALDETAGFGQPYEPVVLKQGDDRVA